MIELKAIAASKGIVDDLNWPFDFSLKRANRNSGWIKLKPEAKFNVIAGDGTGSAFLAYGDGVVESLPILHATSEGQAGKIAANLAECLALLMALPYWRDLLKFSGGGKLKEMRTTATFMEREYEKSYPKLPDVRARLVKALRIPSIDDPIKTLHSNVKSTDCTLVAEDGTEWQSLFNSFVSRDNPTWR